MSSFDTLGLRAELLRALAESGYTTPTPVQAQAIPVILAGNDVLAAAQTGTGKTAGFTLPLLQRLAANRPQHQPKGAPRTLILTPTRELAAQVEESVATYGKYLPLTSTVIYGGVKFNPQVQALRRGVDILVATPGRLLDHVQQRTVALDRVEVLVLDEADRMLDMGFIRDIRRILALLPARRQNLLFSATFSDEIKDLASGLLQSPTYVEVERPTLESELVTQVAYMASQDSKRALLLQLLTTHADGQALVFTRTKHRADRLAKLLAQDGVSAAAIHGDRTQGQRLKALAAFKAGTARVLVATDIAARGLDIAQLPFVINFELPLVAEDYVHRIGRTGRAGSPGTAFSLVSEEEHGSLAAIEKLLKKSLERRDANGAPVAVPALRRPHNPPRQKTPPSPARNERAGRGRGEAERGAGGGGRVSGGGRPAAKRGNAPQYPKVRVAR